MVAFANADGGELLVGVEDEGTVTGVEMLSDKDVDFLLQAPKNNVHLKDLLPAVRQAIVEIEGHRVIYFSVHKGMDYVHSTSDGRCVQRSDLETVPIATEELVLNRQEKTSRQYDRGFIDGASVKDSTRRLN